MFVPVPFSLRTARLRLERITPAHIDELVALDADPLVVRYVGGQSPDRTRYENEIMPRMRAYDDQPFGFVAAYENDGFVGWFHLRPSVVDPAVLELGYRLARSAWGRGLATEGSRGLLRHAFETLGRDVVDACAMPENTASIHVMKKLGMRHQGRIVHPRFDGLLEHYLVRRHEAVL